MLFSGLVFDSLNMMKEEAYVTRNQKVPVYFQSY